MKIKNLTTNKIITDDLTFAKNLKQKSIGLIGQKPKAMLFQTRFGIHTFFMSNPIDILILDKKFKVVKLKENLEPNKLFFWNIKFDQVLELPAGTIKKTQTKLNDKLEIR